MISIILAAALSAEPYTLVLADGRTRLVVSHEVAESDEHGMVVTGEDAEGKSFAYRLEHVDLGRTQAAADAAELAAYQERQGQRTATRTAPRTEPARSTTAATAAPRREAADTSAVVSRLQQIRRDHASADRDLERALAEHRKLVAEHNDPLSTYADRDVYRQRLATAEDKIADLRTRLAELEQDYRGAREDARRAGAPPREWNQSIGGKAASSQ